MAKAPKLATTCEPRPYHHGDLRRALIEAARTIVLRDGVQALSLRAVAREAGVSPAAPYHHFKDKQELMLAVGQLGFEDLGQAMKAAVEEAGADPQSRLTAIGVAYVLFSRNNPAIYRLMYDCSRDMEALPHESKDKDMTGYQLVRQAMIDVGRAAPDDEVGLELATIAAWCAAHGVAEMASFPQFKPLKDALGGEVNFYRELLKRIGAFSGR